MKRILTGLTAILIFAFALSSFAYALPIGTKHMFYITGEQFKITEAYLANGDSARQMTGSFIKDGTGAKGVDIYSKVESTSDYLYQYESNQQMPQDDWKIDSNRGLIMGRFSVYNYNNYLNGTLDNPFKHGVAEYSLNVQQYLKYGKNDPKYNLSASIDFYYWNNANTSGGSWFILTQTAFELGTVTAADGVDYQLYLEVKQSDGTTWPGVSKLTGDLYNQALAYFGFGAGTELYGLYIPADGVAREIGFDIAGYVKSPYAATPIPGAVWLMGTGVAGLLALRGRKSKN